MPITHPRACRLHVKGPLSRGGWHTSLSVTDAYSSLLRGICCREIERSEIKQEFCSVRDLRLLVTVKVGQWVCPRGWWDGNFQYTLIFYFKGPAGTPPLPLLPYMVCFTHIYMFLITWTIMLEVGDVLCYGATTYSQPGQDQTEPMCTGTTTPMVKDTPTAADTTITEPIPGPDFPSESK
jgi:hypothetical protein